MKKHLLLAAVALLIGACSPSAPKNLAADQMEYKLEGDQYAVVVVQEDNMSKSEVKKRARIRAAQMTVKNGYRYFEIISEENVKVVNPNSEQPMPGNLYQELIIQDNFGQESLAQAGGGA